MPTKGEVTIKMKEVVDYSRLMGTFVPTLRNVVERKVTADAAKKGGIKISKEELQRGADTFRHVNGLNSAKATKEWMSRNGISQDFLEEFLETNLLVSKFKDKLVKEAERAKYLDHPKVKELLRNVVYQDWVARNLE
jgi:hypothetical protein